MTPRFTPDLIDIQQELFEFPQIERVTYNKEIQTTNFEPDLKATSIEDIREHFTRERESTVDPERALERLEEESAILDREIEEEVRDLTEEEKN